MEISNDHHKCSLKTPEGQTKSISPTINLTLKPCTVMNIQNTQIVAILADTTFKTILVIRIIITTIVT